MGRKEKQGVKEKIPEKKVEPVENLLCPGDINENRGGEVTHRHPSI